MNKYISIQDLFHVGTLDLSNKRSFSFEGSSGLSVTTEPDAWRRINRGQTFGDTYSINKSSSKFLNVHELNERQQELINRWGVNNGYITPTTKFQIEYHDDELELDVVMTFDSIDEAREEVDCMGDEALEINEVAAFSVTAKFEQEYGSKDESLVVAPFAEKLLGIDGLWWEDTLDVSRYSAPRGLIFQSALSSFVITKIEEPVIQRKTSASSKPFTPSI